MNTQLDLDFNATPQTSDIDLDRLTSWLYARGDNWSTAKIITAELGFTDRNVRALASASNGQILSGPGCPGYKHIRHSDPEEVAQVVARLRHQAHAMDQRCSAVLRAWHNAPHLQSPCKVSQISVQSQQSAATFSNADQVGGQAQSHTF